MIQLTALETEVPPKNAPDTILQAFLERLLQIWWEALALEADWLNLSNAEAKSLTNYLYANELMVRCKDAAVRVSREKWEGIEARMLTVQTSEV